VLDKSALIASLPCQVSKPVLQWSERTNLAVKVHECRPQDRRDVKPGDPNLPKYKEAAQDRKNNKGEVKSQDKIPQCACRLLLILVRNSSWPPNNLHHEGLSMPSSAPSLARPSSQHVLLGLTPCLPANPTAPDPRGRPVCSLPGSVCPGRTSYGWNGCRTPSRPRIGTHLAGSRC
jgi:hypothetical protein